MFRLHRIEITGFKSFADQTELLFTGDGITAIVGPNGCGKSNVADAIAWVLGEQKVKQLRGAEMKDVIFQGSRNRLPSGMAEVVVHMVRDETTVEEEDIEEIDSTLEEIDEQAIAIESSLGHEEVILKSEEQPEPGIDSQAVAVAQNDAESSAPSTEAPTTSLDHKMPIRRRWRPSRLALEFLPGETVSVTRRLYRSGESEYLLNGRACRLRDIHDLFAGTGLSGAHYAIIEQGRIGQILSAKPMDRRTLIEEAAGISKFRVRQRAAETRLDSAKANLSRVSDIVSEIERQVNSLRRQAAKARRYRVFREELRELLRQLFVAEEKSLTTLLQETKARIEETVNQERAIAKQMASAEEESRFATQQARDIEDQLVRSRAVAAEAALQHDRQLREKSYHEEQVRALARRKEDLIAEVSLLQSRLNDVVVHADTFQQKVAQLKSASQERSLTLKEAEDRYNQKLLNVSRAETEIETARNEHLEHTAAAERLMEVARQLELSIKRLAEQISGLEREGQRASAIHSDKLSESETLQADINRARERLKQLSAEREKAVHKVVEGHEAISDTEEKYMRVRDEASRTRHRLDSLLELDAQRAHYSTAVQRLLSADIANEVHVVGTIADLIDVDQNWERAVEGVLGSSLQTVVVPTPEDAIRAAIWLKEQDAGRANLMVMGLHGGDSSGDVAVNSLSAAVAREDGLRIAEVLRATPELLTVMQRTLPHKLDARIVENLDDAVALSLSTLKTYVTLDGDWVSGGQLVSAGDTRTLEKGAGLLQFKRELRELEVRSAKLRGEETIAEEAFKTARDRVRELEDAVVFLNEGIGREERELTAREVTANAVAQEIERADRHMRVVADDLARLVVERDELERRLEQTRQDASAAERARTEAAERISQFYEKLSLARMEAETENKRLSHERADAATADERLRSVASELKHSASERDELQSRIDRHNSEIGQIEQRASELSSAIKATADIELGIEEAKAQEERALAVLTSRLEEARQQADRMALDLAEMNKSSAVTREARAQFEVQQAEASARLNYLRETCLTELNQSLETLADQVVTRDDFSIESARSRVEDLRARLEGFGAVNMMALEELSESEERLDFLTRQRQDILDSIGSTEEALREIKRRSRERFRNAFDEINRNFGELFQELFGGGRGEMSLIDSDDVLESGIDIIAQPPGKRLQNVLLLSGGEKAMAALALVLAIFKYRPSPFCLLDEVDAPLDEANIGRFTEKIRQMAARTQFIIITHSKRTMEMARALYGVTMEEVGVSRLVSVRFE